MMQTHKMLTLCLYKQLDKIKNQPWNSTQTNKATMSVL